MTKKGVPSSLVMIEAFPVGVGLAQKLPWVLGVEGYVGPKRLHGDTLGCIGMYRVVGVGLSSEGFNGAADMASRLYSRSAPRGCETDRTMIASTCSMVTRFRV